MIDEKLFAKEVQKYFVNNTIHKNDLAEVIARLPKVGEWIPVSERLPEDFEKVLTCDKHGNIHVMSHFHLFEVPFSIYQNDTRYYQPVAWQPLPEPYRKDVE